MNDSMFCYWGKAGRKKEDENKYHLLVYHNLDVAAVGKVLLKRHRNLRKRLANALEVPEDIFCALAVFFLSVHDLGKFSEAFQGLRRDLYFRLQGRESEKLYNVRHDTLGYLAWQTLLNNIQDREISVSHSAAIPFKNQVFDAWVQAVMGHHGKPPEPDMGARSFYVEKYFNDKDLEVAESFIREAIALFLTEAVPFEHLFEDTYLKQKIRQVTYWLAGLSVLCDWIGSDSQFFPFCSDKMELDEYWECIALKNAQKAVDACGILPESKSFCRSVSDLFEYIETPTPLQRFCHKHPLTSEPQLWILEDVTGSGKTEAALILAHRLMNKKQGEGLFIGLPTMATTNAMYERMGGTYRNLFDSNAHPSLILSHSARHLSEKFRQSILHEQKQETTYERGEADASTQCNAWIANHQKKALLADVGVGTLDQALLGILPVRHQSLRLLGLMNKVLILDEVHAYDSYTQKLIHALLTFHAAMGGSAVLLTATLTLQMKTELAKAFHKGVERDFEDDEVTLDLFFDDIILGETDAERDLKLTDSSYPLVTVVAASDQAEYPINVRESVEREVAVAMVHDEAEVYRMLTEAAEKKQCACWIRNTVADAMNAFETLKKDYGVLDESLLLFHSRYTLADRIAVEGEVLNCFGKKSGPMERSGKILIATQVVEQSLDLDFDVMISDLSPVDLLIQRLGRLHRHVRWANGKIKKQDRAADDRPAPVFHVLGPKPVTNAEEDWFMTMFPKGAFVYPNVGQLWRTARLLEKFGRIRMPDDARALIEGVFNDDEAEEIPEGLQEKTGCAEGDEMAKGGMGEFNTLILKKGYCENERHWGDDARFPTRLGDDSITVYLARYQDEQLYAWRDGEYSWDLSSLKVRASNLSGIPDTVSNELKNRLESLKEDEKGLNEYSLILPLTQRDEDVWECECVDSRGKLVTVTYSRYLGLQIYDLN